MARSEAKNWCFTTNNPGAEDRLCIIALRDHAVYYVVGQERGDEGTPHYQGYVCFKRKLRLTAVKKLLPRSHLEVARGTPREASGYCKKDDDFEEWGDLPASPAEQGGHAVALKYEAAWDLAKAGKIEDIDITLRVRHYHTWTRIRQDHQVRPPDLDDVCGHWYYGAPRTGKSYAARRLPGTYYDKPANKWWDGYQGEDVVIVDDFDLTHKVLGHHLKRWADRYAFPAEMKGTTIQVRPKLLVVTSNYSIEQIFEGDPVLVDALRRRFKVKHFSGFFPAPQAPQVQDSSYPFDRDE